MNDRPDRRADVAPADVVVVGAASRDLTDDDPRGWRLGGPVSYVSLWLARLGLRVAAVVGADAAATGARELDLLREAGVDLHLVPLRHGPVFQNRETRAGRIQRTIDVADPLPPRAAGARGFGATAARGWFLAPIGAELSDEWAREIPATALVALGWQGLLRTFRPDGRVVARPPTASALLDRADIVGVSRHDIDPKSPLDAIAALLSPDATLALTNGIDGGVLIGPNGDRGRAIRRYPAVRSARSVDPTGAGDSFLAGLFAARLEPRLIGGRSGRGLDLLLAAAMASLVVEDHGLDGVATRSAVRDRMREALAGNRRPE